MILKITVQKNEQHPEIVIDLSDTEYAYSVREAFKMALDIHGFTQEFIDSVFNREKEDERG